MTNSTTTAALQSKFTLGEQRVDPGINQIQGLHAVTQVEPKAMAVLCALAGRAGETLGREELMAAVWPGRVVVEETLTRAISQLRTALSDDASNPRYIQTVPKQGYRLIATVTVADSAGLSGRPAATDTPTDAELQAAAPINAPINTPRSPAPRRLITGLPGAVMFTLLVALALYLSARWTPQEPELAATSPAPDGAMLAQPSVAVMPFRNPGSDDESAYFAEGIAEELLNALAGVPGLRVPSRRSSFAFKGRQADLSSIAAQLKVRHVLEGSVRRSGNTIRLSAQLVDASTDTTVWSQQFDGQLEDIFSVQEEIAQQVIASLRGTLLGDTQSSTRIARSENLDAYNLYLQGQYWWMNGTTSNWWYRARDAFERAIELDPEFADAHAGLAYIYARFNFYDEYMPAAEARPRSESAIRTALALDARVVDAYLARAILAGTRGEYASASADLDRALQLSPNSSSAHFLYSEVWLAENQPDKAIAAALQALDIDPLSPWVNVNMAIVRFSVGQWEKAMAAVAHAIELDPNYTWAYVWRARIEHVRGNLAQAIKAMHHSVRIDPASESSAAYLGLLYLELGDVERAGPWLTHAASLHGDNSAALFWQGFIALAYEGKNPATLLMLSQDMSLLETPTYDLVPILHAAQVATGTPDGAIARISARHPELLRQPLPQVSIGNASSAIALIYLLREQGDAAQAQALLDAALATAALFPSQFRWQGHDAELLALAGRKQEAIAALRLSFESGWRVNRWMLEQSPALAALHSEPGFAAVLQAADLASAEQHARMLEMESSGALGG